MFKRQIYRRLFSEHGLLLPLGNPGVLPGLPHTDTRQNSSFPKLILQTVTCYTLHSASWALVRSWRYGEHRETAVGGWLQEQLIEMMSLSAVQHRGTLSLSKLSPALLSQSPFPPRSFSPNHMSI